MSEGEATPFLQLHGLAKSFGSTRVLEDFTVELAEGEILALLGLSGSGKTTALRLLAGFEQPDEGEIRVAGQEVSAQPPESRGFGMVFQHYALFPHMSVAQNVAFGLESQKWAKAEIPARVAEMLTLVDLAGFAGRRVSEISGGQQQRVALARALAPEPRLLLLDEPLSNLDPSLRERTREELRAAVRRVGITTVLVTHEQEEAFHVGDRIAVLNAGRLEQVGTAEELYRQPRSRFVASFIGRASGLMGTVGEAGGGDAWVSLDAAGGSPSADSGAPPEVAGTSVSSSVSWSGMAVSRVASGDRAELVVRPEALQLVDGELPGSLPGVVREMRFTGLAMYAVIELSSGERVEVLTDADSISTGQTVRLAPRSPESLGRAPRPRIFPAKGGVS